MKNFLEKRVLWAFFLLLSLYFVTISTGTLTLRTYGGELLYEFPAPGGFSFTTRFTHSVERMPVETEYRVSGGLIRQWEERVKSHNAGLPFRAARRSRFLTDGEWMRFRGGGVSFRQIRYRVGNGEHGRNVLILSGREIELFSLYPDEILIIEAEERSPAGRAIVRFLTAAAGLLQDEDTDKPLK